MSAPGGSSTWSRVEVERTETTPHRCVAWSGEWIRATLRSDWLGVGTRLQAPFISMVPNSQKPTDVLYLRFSLLQTLVLNHHPSAIVCLMQRESRGQKSRRSTIRTSD